MVSITVEKEICLNYIALNLDIASRSECPAN